MSGTLHDPSSWRPKEDALTLFSERAWLQGAFLATVAYGMQVVLFASAAYLLYKRKNDIRNVALLVYICVIFGLGTLYMGGLLKFTQLCFIDQREYPGGPSAYEDDMFSIPVDMLANVTLVICNWLCDIINVWRCFVIYNGSQYPVWIFLTIPILMYITSFALGILWLKQVGTVDQSPWDSSGINYTIPYYSMSLALNILVTLLIVTRLLLYRHRVRTALGVTHGTHYTSLAAMVVESAAIYSVYSLLFLVPFAMGHPLAQLFLQGLSPVQNVTTFLIIFRVASGKGWDNHRASQMLTQTHPHTGKRSDNTAIRFGPAQIGLTTTAMTETEMETPAEETKERTTIELNPLHVASASRSSSYKGTPNAV
ncbi:hypothetical protein BD626DRAFT_544008 [Schizophyllum amplum]|uniref:Uncharacterized protein n=1 Tax=Schizophyllum amplum TaxID=97359 RepID=A0A550CWM2_9AGAR|nr:hypothetical protein BD626DRAFT_544008 [Auriculariopsis ampla]